MFESASHRSRLSTASQASICERIAQVDLVRQGLPDPAASSALAGRTAAALACVSIEGRAGSMQTHDMDEDERAGCANRIGRVVARIRCAGATPAEAQRRCAEALLRAVEGPSGALQVRCEFPASGVGELVADSPASLDGVSIEAWIAGDRIGRLSVRTTGGDLLHGAKTSGSVELETSGGRLDVVCHRGELRAVNHAGRVLLHRVSGRVEVRSRRGDIVIRTAADPLRADLGDSSLASIAACADEGDIDLDLRGGWHSAGRVTVFDARSGERTGHSIEFAPCGSEAILAAPRGTVAVSRRPER